MEKKNPLNQKSDLSYTVHLVSRALHSPADKVQLCDSVQNASRPAKAT